MLLLPFFLAVLLGPAPTSALTADEPRPGGYLFVTFRGEATENSEQVHFLLSRDGREWQALSGGEPVLVSTVGERGLRDPFVLRTPDGQGFHLLATDLSIHRNGDWNRAQTAGSRSIVVFHSADLVHWSEPKLVEVAPQDAGCTWAPEAIHDDARGEFLVFWASKTARDGFAKQRIWAATTQDFEHYSAPFVYVEKPTTVIDTTIVRDGEWLHRFTKDEEHKAITLEASQDLWNGWEPVEDFTLGRMVGYEGPTCFRLAPAGDGAPARWCLLLDWYARGQGYQCFETSDLTHGDFTAAEAMRFPFHPVRHGTVLEITDAEFTRLLEAYGDSVSSPVRTSGGSSVGASDAPGSNRPAANPIDPGQRDPTHHNPVLPGYFADPSVLWSRKTGRLHLYPTSDGFDHWSSTSFQSFSSADGVQWRDDGVVLDLADVRWADRSAWAPCVLEEEFEGAWRYFYYFTAAQKIGVAVGDDPSGPFRDVGRPLIDMPPAGVRGGQEIDPEVFRDPVSRKVYLYWGNGYLAVAELDASRTALREPTTALLTPDATYREGTHVFFREGRYYFLWSEDDTRSPDYRVRYAWSSSPTGPLTIPKDNVVIQKDPAQGIYGTGHDSSFQVPGKDEWYLVYHRFCYPDGITMGEAAGYHREVCIDRMNFDAEGRILPVRPTHTGVSALR